MSGPQKSRALLGMTVHCTGFTDQPAQQQVEQLVVSLGAVPVFVHMPSIKPDVMVGMSVLGFHYQVCYSAASVARAHFSFVSSHGSMQHAGHNSNAATNPHCGAQLARGLSAGRCSSKCNSALQQWDTLLWPFHLAHPSVQAPHQSHHVLLQVDYSPHRLKPFAGLEICISGYVRRKLQLGQHIKDHGGRYNPELNRATCHVLVCEQPTGQKFKYVVCPLLHTAMCIAVHFCPTFMISLPCSCDLYYYQQRMQAQKVKSWPVAESLFAINNDCP